MKQGAQIKSRDRNTHLVHYNHRVQDLTEGALLLCVLHTDSILHTDIRPLVKEYIGYISLAEWDEHPANK